MFRVRDIRIDRCTKTCFGKRATLCGTNGRDRLTGTRQRDVIVGRGGNDIINGRGGDDRICCGEDTLLGGKGKDEVRGDEGQDRLVGGKGRDTLRGGEGNDTLVGGPGDDRLNGGLGRHTCDAGSAMTPLRDANRDSGSPSPDARVRPSISPGSIEVGTACLRAGPDTVVPDEVLIIS